MWARQQVLFARATGPRVCGRLLGQDRHGQLSAMLLRWVHELCGRSVLAASQSSAISCTCIPWPGMQTCGLMQTEHYLLPCCYKA